MKKSQLKKIIKEEISKVLEMEIEKWSPERKWDIYFGDLSREATEKYGNKMRTGGTAEFSIPYKTKVIPNGKIEFKANGKKVEVTYLDELGGEELSSYTMDLEKALNIIRHN